MLTLHGLVGLQQQGWVAPDGRDELRGQLPAAARELLNAALLEAHSCGVRLG